MVSKKIRIVLDSSAIIAGVLSPEGGAGAILYACQLGIIELLLSPGIIKEATQKFEEKFPELSREFRQLLKSINPTVVTDPTVKEIKFAARLINKDDAPILAATLSAPIDYLVTLDKDFLTKQVKESVTFQIVTPKEFLEIFN